MPIFISRPGPRKLHLALLTFVNRSGARYLQVIITSEYEINIINIWHLICATSYVVRITFGSMFPKKYKYLLGTYHKYKILLLSTEYWPILLIWRSNLRYILIYTLLRIYHISTLSYTNHKGLWDNDIMRTIKIRLVCSTTYFFRYI